jgi:hypothetical protein
VGFVLPTSDTRRVNLVTNPVISHELGKDREVFTSGTYQGRIQRGAHPARAPPKIGKNIRAEGGAKIVGVFRVKNHDFTPKNRIFSNCEGRRENVWGISCEKSRFYALQNIHIKIKIE